MPRSKLYSAEQLQAIEAVRELVSIYGLTARDIDSIDQQLQRDRERSRQTALTVARQLAEYWQLTEADLKGPLPAAAPPVRTKYRHPQSGEAWDGVGPQPEWLKKALLTDGYRVSELLVDDATALDAQGR